MSTDSERHEDDGDRYYESEERGPLWLYVRSSDDR